MAIQLYDTLTREKTTFEPLQAGSVGLYLCGPTVYDDCHIGHLMGPVLYDAVARWLIVRGNEVRFVINITDIDDKIIRRSLETGEPWDSIAGRYTEQYFGFMRELKVTTVTDHPRCTQYVPQMVEFIARLVVEDRAYEAADGVYYDVVKQPGYGKLSGRRLEDMLEGGASDDKGLRNSADFALWKKAKPGEPSWPSPWGEGRPGWHIECSVMSSELLGGEFDLHGGGDDLKFPHHENELAQSEAHGDGFAKRWMHHGLVQYGGKKIAKSDPRMQDVDFSQQFQARWLIDTYGAPALRFFLLRGHYRRPVDFEPKNLHACGVGLARLHKQLGDKMDETAESSLDEILARDLDGELTNRRERFCAAMDDDFNTAVALAELFAIEKHARSLEGDARDAALQLMRDLGRLLGLFQVGDRIEAASHDQLFDDVMKVLIGLRTEARERKDFALSDAIRDRLQAIGIELRDGKDGSSWEAGC